ncbi:orotidine 5'-phosphate decarboxylase [Halobacillus litoralis]|uniref:3-hexulose-6-phosphate synthase n=1 Tax=Halobacillus litoralis TaxID=45668 RepID=UPI001CD3BD2D|nr:3-hexulose-6-phosphate synthase [Halobacillus litoralis]MCA0972155.1 orotidine 5'-phosphate decarboxylase [Halobacillus litoralis]
MNLQVALDRLTEEECDRILASVDPSIDWIEIGTGVIKEYGMDIVRSIRKKYPDKTIVADMKTCDAGAHEARQVFEAGADITTVMAFAADQTIIDMQEVAEGYGGRVMVDLLGVFSKERVAELVALNVDLVSLHFGKDMQQKAGMDVGMFSIVRDFPDLDVAVAGGLTLETLPDVLKHQPDTLIVGSGITKSDDPQQQAAKLKGVMTSYERDHADRRS